MEVWLRTNSRALLFGMVPPALFGGMGLLLLVGLPGREPPAWLRVAGGVLLAISLLTITALAWQMRKPRLAYRDGELLLWLRSGGPIRIPVRLVECFLLGQAPSLLPGGDKKQAETSALVLRVADRAVEWHRQDVKPQLGKWCEGYITIRGTWCEPLSVPLVNRLNARLAEVSRDVSRSAPH
jgi:hypothetical protein